MMNAKTTISVQNVCIGYIYKRKQIRLYEHLNFDLYRGELISLLGPNGAGKSTLLRTLSKQQPLLEGNIQLNDKNLTDYNERTISRVLGLVLTDKTSTGGLNVRELVELGRYPYTNFFGRLSDEDNQIIDKAMKDTGIFHKADSYMAELSDGEKQKVMIAKALAQECPIIVLDEPTAFLDIESRIEIMALLHDLALYHHKTILLSTHDIDLAIQLSDRLLLLSPQTGIEYGITEKIVSSGVLEEIFDKEIVSFDKNTGNFIPKNNKSNAKIFIQADPKTDKWIYDIAKKNGFETINHEKESIYKIIALSPTSFLLKNKEKELYASSLEEIYNWIKSAAN